MNGVAIQADIGDRLRILVRMHLFMAEFRGILEHDTEDDASVEVHLGLGQERQEDVLRDAQWTHVLSVASASY